MSAIFRGEWPASPGGWFASPGASHASRGGRLASPGGPRGARILVGPSLHWIRSDRRLMATLAGGPVFCLNANEQTSAAPRDLENGYVIRASLAAVF